MDIVITYVNSEDPLWAQDYSSAVGGEAASKRFRDWGTLRYIFRGIEKNIPFARKVHLVVARESQVPEWIDRSKVNVVLHKDFIPEQYLPLFNSSSIEVFLHRIPGLDEQFIYLNDDFFPVRPCTPETFFIQGKSVIGMRRHLLSINSFKKRIKFSYRLACRAAGLEPTLCFCRPQHICYNLLRSSCEQIYSGFEQEILSSVTPLRGTTNYNISLFLDYIHLSGRSINKSLPGLHISLGAVPSPLLRALLALPSRNSTGLAAWGHKFLCINDVKMSERRRQRLQSVILSGLERLFPEKSAFEK